MNTQVNRSQTLISPARLPRAAKGTAQLPAGAGLALAVLLGSACWVGIFALLLT